MPRPLRVTIWNEYIHERQNDSVCAIYPEGMHAVWAEALSRLLGDCSANPHRDAGARRTRPDV